MSDFAYPGTELDLFSSQRNWKAYWARQLRPFVKGDVLEVGAGIGSNTPFLDSIGGTGRWVCLEPDPALSARLTQSLGRMRAGRSHEVVCGTIDRLSGQKFDTIVYIDVLEHIRDDREELDRAVMHLRPGGHIIVLSPAHPRLFSPYDAAIGHVRRYNARMLRNISPPALRLERLRYLDCAGLILSAANTLFLRQSMPTPAQLRFWDRWMVPLSRVLDKVFLYSVGKTIVAIWRL